MIHRFLVLGLALVLPAFGQVKIHDPIVRMLAKPFGIEKRIRLAAIHAVDFGPDGSGRLTLTLQNCGVKEVRLESPGFQLEVAAPGGGWTGLGKLHASEILFPETDGKSWVQRKYVVDYRPSMGGAEVTRHLREAAAQGRAFRLIGHSAMRVKRGEGKEFHRERLKLELGGKTALGRGFKPEWHRTARDLPKCGFKG